MGSLNQPLDILNAGRTVHIGVILPGSWTEILDVAPIDFLHSITKTFTHQLSEEFLSAEQKAQAPDDLEFHWVNETGEPARLTAGCKVVPTDTFTTCPPLDVALMGAFDLNYKLTEAELAFIRKTYDSCTYFLTICGGFMAPLHAGLLSGKSATAPRPMIPLLRETAPDVKWTEKRWQKSEDGKVWTSGTLLNGLDMVSAWAEECLVPKGEDASRHLIGTCLRMCEWPKRNVDYEDEV